MLSLDQAGSFFLVSVLLALAPGPDNLFVLNQSIASGRKAGLLVTAGLCTGLIYHTGLVLLGVAALIATSPALFALLKILGASYLLVLAYGSVRAGLKPMTPSENKVLNHGQLYRRGVILNISNPKVTLFFLALLPQFIDVQDPHSQLQVLQLGLLFAIATLIVFGLIAVAAGSLTVLLRQHPLVYRSLEFTSALVFLGIAVPLLWTELTTLLPASFS